MVFQSLSHTDKLCAAKVLHKMQGTPILYPSWYAYDTNPRKRAQTRTHTHMLISELVQYFLMPYFVHLCSLVQVLGSELAQMVPKALDHHPGQSQSQCERSARPVR